MSKKEKVFQRTVLPKVSRLLGGISKRSGNVVSAIVLSSSVVLIWSDRDYHVTKQSNTHLRLYYGFGRNIRVRGAE